MVPTQSTAGAGYLHSMADASVSLQLLSGNPLLALPALFLRGVLTWVTQTKSAATGFVYLLTFSLGMCTLLVIVGLSTGGLARLPRAGAWMLVVKKVFALVMLGAAEYYLVKMGQLII